MLSLGKCCLGIMIIWDSDFLGEWLSGSTILLNSSMLHSDHESRFIVHDSISGFYPLYKEVTVPALPELSHYYQSTAFDQAFYTSLSASYNSHLYSFIPSHHLPFSIYKTTLNFTTQTMSAFTALPSEIIAMIFKRIDRIEDVLNWADSCRRFKAFIPTRNDMIRTMKAVLAHPHYENDIQLCRLLKSISIPRPEHGSTVESFLSCFNREADQLEDDEVIAIIELRHQIRSVHKLYLNESIQGQYRQSNFPAGRNEWSDIFECTFQETTVRAGASKDPSAAYRFCGAVVAFWVIMEARKLIIKTGYQSQNSQDVDRYNSIMESFWGKRRTLLQMLDMLEVHDFLYGFLIRKMYFRAWPVINDENNPNLDESWAKNLQLLGAILSPLEVARLGSVELDFENPDLWKELPVNQTQYYLQYQEVPAPLSRYGFETLSLANLLEFNLGHDLLVIGSIESEDAETDINLVEAWAQFRRNWPNTARGTIFHSLHSSEEFLEILRRTAPKERERKKTPKEKLKERSEDPFFRILSRKALGQWMPHPIV